MGDTTGHESTFRKEAFFEENYELTYTPLAAIPLTQSPENAYSDFSQYRDINGDENLPQKNLQAGEVNNQWDYDENSQDDDFDQTEYVNELWEMPIKQESIDIDDSQIQANQDFIVKIDEIFDESPLETYIERLLSYTKGKEGLLTWYRNILICRLKGLHDNPLFVSAPVQTKNTSKSSSAYKYAKDCYNLSLYINGDMTAAIEDIFSSRQTKASQSTSQQNENLQESGVEILGTKQLIQSLRGEVTEMKKSHLETVKQMQSSIALLEKENKDLKRSLHRLESEFSSKVVQYDSKLKQLTSVGKDLENLNPFEINTKLNNLETNRKRMDNAINRLQSASGKQSNKSNSQVESPIQMATSRSPCISAHVVNTGEKTGPCRAKLPRKYQELCKRAIVRLGHKPRMPTATQIYRL